MIFLFSLLQTALCTEEELKQLETKNTTAIANHVAACDVLEKSLEKIAGDFCKKTATEDEKTVVYAELLDVFAKSSIEFAHRTTQLKNFNANFPKDVKDNKSEDINKFVRLVKQKFDSEYLDLTSMITVNTSFAEVYYKKLVNLDCVLDIDDGKTALDNADKMFKDVADTYMKVAYAFKEYYEKKIAMFKQKGEEKAEIEKKETESKHKDVSSGDYTGTYKKSYTGTSKDDKDTDKDDKKKGTSIKTIIIVIVAMVGGLVVLGLMIYEFVFKKKANQRNNENSNEQAEVEELSDDYYNHRNGRGYQNNNRFYQEGYQNNSQPRYISGENNNSYYQGNDQYRRVN